MRKFALVICLTLAALTSAAMFSVFAQTATSSWAFFLDVTPGSGGSGIYDLTVPLQVMDKARADLADLRLYDAQGKEIPYALRIRREIDDRRKVGGRLFNQANVGSTASEVC